MKMALLAYLVLLVLTVLYVMAVVAVYRRSRDLTIPVGAFLAYFWTLMGAWPFIIDASTGYMGYRIGLAYYYLMEKMFPFEVDGDYVEALLLLGSFLFGLAAAWLLMFGRRQLAMGPTRQVIPVDHTRLIIGGLSVMLLSFLLIVPDIRRAMHEDVSVYLAVSNAGGARAALHGLLNEMVAICLIVGYAVRLSEAAPYPLFLSRNGKWADRAYPLALLLAGLFFVFIGDRHPLFLGSVIGCLLLFQLYGRQGWRPALPLVLICAGSIVLAGWVRSFTWNEVATLKKFETPRPDPYPYDLPLIAHVPAKKGALADVLEPVWTNELFAAHFSMYGVLRREVPLAPGMSFNYLLHAFIPSFLADRPSTIYDHYAAEARLVPGQGYTIHQATAWYLNVGWPGPFIGGFVLGLLWTGARWIIHRGRVTSRVTAILQLVPFLFVAFLPQLLRSGPEAYKGLLVEGFAIPLVVMFLAGGGLTDMANHTRHAD